ncbi:ABC transporter substrate-binding protein [Sulfitobacter sediminilitoris]|uniref:ABC transporter substrate-binding protein n=1 Tax=Sulfitobacter sediminilitoris TaxID=2698830 RepID=UPI002E2BF1B2|nr:extracellular solute-binding protein [Sulfitobacter sediminilitoris]
MTSAAASTLAAPPVHKELAPLRLLGTSVTQVEAVKSAAEADLGIALDFVTLDGAAAQRRGALQPRSFDVYDQWFHDLDLVWPTGSLQPIEIARLHRWEDINELPKTGRLGPDARRAAGGDPSQLLYVQLDGGLGNTPTRHVSMVPTVHNADGFAVLGDDTATSWGALLDPERAGRVILQSDPAIGALDILMALQAKGQMRPANMADLSLEEVDVLVDHLAQYRASGQFHSIWTDESEAVSAMQQGEPMIGSLWWSGAIRLRAMGVPVRMVSPQEGCRGWFGGLALSVHLSGRECDAAYEYLNWWLDGGPGAILTRNGAYLANHSAVRTQLSPDEWNFWYGGQPARAPISDAQGNEVYAAGEAREGGSYHDRMGRVVVWDTVMTEHNYLMRRWAHALAS